MKGINRVHTLGICAMPKKVNSKHMQKILKNIKKFEEFELVYFTEEIIFCEEIENWPIVESMIVFFSTGFPFNKVLDYIKLRKPFLVNDFESQKIFWDRREVAKKLREYNIPTPEGIIIDRGEIIDNDRDNDTSIELNTTAERIRMIDDYFKDKENNLVNDINDYKKINKNDFNFNNYWNEIQKNNLCSEINNKNYERDSLFCLEKTYSNSSINMLKLSPMKNRLSNSNSVSKNSQEEDNEDYYSLESINKSLKEFDEYIEFHGKKIYKPFVEKPANGDDHNIYIYYPHCGGQKRLFRKTKNLSSLYYPNNNKIRRDKSYIYEEFLQSDGFDIKVYTVGEDYFHAEERKSPTLDGVVQRTEEGKEVRYPVNLTPEEKNIARKIVQIFKQNICGFDILRSKGKSFVCDVNGWSFVKGNNKYYEDCAIQIRKIILNHIDKELLLVKEIKLPETKIFEDMVLEKKKKGEKLRSIVAVFRHADRSPKQKLKFLVKEPEILKLFDIFYNENIITIKDNKEIAKDLKLKKPNELLTIFNIVEDILNSIDLEEEKVNFDNDNFYIKLFQIKLILEKNLNFEGLTRKVQLRPKKWKKITINENNQIKTKYKIEEALFIIKWGGRITHSGIKQTKLLGNTFRTKLYLSNKQTGEDLLRLHSTYQHDLKCYSSEEGRSLKTAAAFLQGLLQLDGSLIPIVTSMVRNDDKVSKLLDASNSDIEHLRNNVKKNLEELFHAEGNLKDKYNKILFNNIDKTKYNIDKIKRRQKPYYDLIDDIGNFQNEMFNIYELLDSFIKHLKTFLCSDEILTECDTYFVRNRFSIRPRNGSLYNIKNKILTTMKKIQKRIKKRANSVIKGKKNEVKKEEENKENKIDIHHFYSFDCEEEKVILIYKRYTKLYQEFYDSKSKKFDIGKIPAIYDNIKYDIIHNKSIINKDGFKLYFIANKLACFLMPLEYGININEKFNIGINLIKPLLTKIKNDLLLINTSQQVNNKNEDILQENKYSSLNKNEKNVKTRFYFTSQSHLYALFNSIIYAENSFLVDDKKDINPIWKIFDLDYCSHIVFRLFENFNVKENDDKRYRIEIDISPGANKDPKNSDSEHMISVNPWIVVNDHLTMTEFNKFFKLVLK